MRPFRESRGNGGVQDEIIKSDGSLKRASVRGCRLPAPYRELRAVLDDVTAVVLHPKGTRAVFRIVDGRILWTRAVLRYSGWQDPVDEQTGPHACVRLCPWCGPAFPGGWP